MFILGKQMKRYTVDIAWHFKCNLYNIMTMTYEPDSSWIVSLKRFSLFHLVHSKDYFGFVQWELI